MDEVNSSTAPKNEYQYNWEGAVLELKSDPAKAELVKAAYYDDPLKGAADRYYASSEWRYIREYLPEQKNLVVLDLGAGRGISSYAFAMDGHMVTALEPDDSHVVGYKAIEHLAKEAKLDISISKSVEAISLYPDNTFDVIFARAVFHHIETLEDACKELFRIMKNGGRLIVVREHVISKIDDLEKFQSLHPLHKYYGGEHAYRLNDYRTAIRNSGFTIQHELAPFDSPINYAPLSETDLKHTIAEKLSSRAKILKTFARFMFSSQIIWKYTKRILNIVDNRPGRLYSFIAFKE